MSTVDAIYPSWLFPSPREPRPVDASLERMQFEHALDPILELVMSGKPFPAAVREYPVAINLGRFNAWVQRNPERKQRLTEAEEIQTKVLAGEMIEIADGLLTPLEDVQRSKLRIDTRGRIIAAHNRKVYGESKQIDIHSTNISVIAALQQAQSRRDMIPLLQSEAIGYDRDQSTARVDARENDDGGSGE